MSNITPSRIYHRLLELYGPQGWWPVGDYNPGGGYHRGDYSVPRSQYERFEICVGAILTQNTAWKNVRLALKRMADAGALNPLSITEMNRDELADLIRPAGYFNQKARKLQGFSTAYNHFSDEGPQRDEVLAVWGVGPETADSILLYAFSRPEFVIDAYTTRLALRLGIPAAEKGYETLKRWFSDGVETEVSLYQEFHALLVAHGKRFYSRQPRGVNDPLLLQS